MSHLIALPNLINCILICIDDELHEGISSRSYHSISPTSSQSYEQ